MKLGVWSLLAAPIMLAFLLLYLFSKRYKGCRWGLLAKCGGSYVAVLTAAVGFLCAGLPAEKPAGGSPLQQPLLWGLLLCMAADALLELYFPAGVACFGLGHICLILWLASFPLSLWSIGVFLPVYLFQLVLFRRDIREKRRGKTVFYLYPIVLIAMAAIAALLPFTAGAAYAVPAIGAVLFVVSDFLVAKSFFRKTDKGGAAKIEGGVIMVTYYTALYLLSAAAWIH